MNTIEWLLSGDVSVQYETHKYILNSSENVLTHVQHKIGKIGFAAQLLKAQHPNGYWGTYYYQPKWTSTHYTLLDLKNLSLPLSNALSCKKIITQMLDDCMAEDGSINLAKSNLPSDVCVDGMILNYASYFCPDEPRIQKLVEFILSQQRQDGGFTWYVDQSNGDPHSTICVLEGLQEYINAGFQYKSNAVKIAQKDALRFFSHNQLFLHEKRLLLLKYPYRYFYSILRILEFFAKFKVAPTALMYEAKRMLDLRKQPNGRWNLDSPYKGATHFEMEAAKQNSRFVTAKLLIIENYLKKF